MAALVYFSSKSQNTHRFILKLGLPAQRIPLDAGEEMLKVREPYVLITPTYAGNQGENAVPRQVIRFLNDPENRTLIKGVIAGGNRNFGKYYAHAGNVIAEKCKVPCLYRFELMGTNEDVENIKIKLQEVVA